MSNLNFLSASILSVVMASVALPASAGDISDYEVITQETSVSSLPSKQLIVECPSGKYALGGGWAALDSTGAYIQGRVEASLPAWNGSSWTFNVSNISTYEMNWKLRGRVICATVTGT